MGRPGLLIALLFWGVVNLPANAAPASSVTLAWDPSASPNVAGYRLYQGGASQNYTNVLDVGDHARATIIGLLRGSTYFFAVTAYDLAGLESAFSQEISYTVPTPGGARLQLNMDSAGQLTIIGTGPAAYEYSVLVSPDLANWTVIGSVAADARGSLEFTDITSTLGLGNTRYYRLQQIYPPQPARNAPSQPAN